MKTKQEIEKLETLKGTLPYGYMRLKENWPFRKNWKGYCYLDRQQNFAGDQLFIQHHIYVHFKKISMIAPRDEYQFCFCRVQKKDAELFEACLVQLHTILSAEEGYRKTLEEISGQLLEVLHAENKAEDRTTAD